MALTGIFHRGTHLTDDEEDDGHSGAGQSDQHEELEPENQSLKGNKADK